MPREKRVKSYTKVGLAKQEPIFHRKLYKGQKDKDSLFKF